MWESGTSTGFLSFQKFFVPNRYGLKWPQGTYGGISGKVGSSGLLSISDHTLATGTQWSSNYVDNIVFSPSTIYFDTTNSTGSEKSIKLKLSFRLANPVPIGGKLVFTAKSGTTLPFKFKNNPSTFCTLSNSIKVFGCEIVDEPFTSFSILLTDSLSTGTSTLTMYGIETRDSGIGLPGVYKVEMASFIPGGTTSNDLIDSFDTEAVLNLVQYQEDGADALLNILKIENLWLSEDNAGFRSRLTIDVTLGNNKIFYANDLLSIDLSDGAYVTTTSSPMRPVFCEIVDTETKKLITVFKSCDATDLGNIKITSSVDTGYNKFTVLIASYVNPTAVTNPPTAKLLFIDDPAYVIQEPSIDLLLAWPTLVASTNLNFLKIKKNIAFVGLRTQLILEIKTQNANVTYQSRFYLKFPYLYDSNLGSFPISCYLDDGTTLSKLYCWMFRERVLAISGFRTDYEPQMAIKIQIFGVEQPETIEAEEFFLGFDNDDQSSHLDEAAYFGIPPRPSPIVDAVQLLEIISQEYTHKSIRAKNDFMFSMTSPLDIPAGAFIYIYIDYLNYEFDTIPEEGSCIVQESPTTASIADSCKREGNRIKIVLSQILVADTEYTILVKGIPTPDFQICNAKKFSVFVTDSALTLLLISTDFFQNTQVSSFVSESELLYLNYVGLEAGKSIQMIKGVYNMITIQREDGERLNDDFVFELASTENGIFGQLESTAIVDYDSVFGLESYPLLISSSMNSFTNEIPVQITLTPRFQTKTFSKLPSLLVRLTSNKASLNIPEITVFIGKQSLPFYVALNQLPVDEINFNVTFEGTVNLTASPSFFTLSKEKRSILMVIKSLHPVGPSEELPSIIITPSEDTGYGVSSQTVTLKTLEEATGPYSIVESSTDKYWFSIDWSAPKPAAMYVIAVPHTLYRMFSRDFIIGKYESGKLTDQYYYIEYLKVEGTRVLNIPVFTDRLTSNKKYNVTFYWEDIDGLRGEILLNTETKDSPGGFGYFNITFSSVIQDTTKPDLLCKIAQLLSFPLEKYKSFINLASNLLMDIDVQANLLLLIRILSSLILRS